MQEHIHVIGIKPMPVASPADREAPLLSTFHFDLYYQGLVQSSL